MQLPSIILILLSCIAFLVNNIIYQYQGCNYIPEKTPGLAIILMLVYLGLVLEKSHLSNLKKKLQEFMIFCGSMLVIAFATNAVQYTPFLPIDLAIVNFETKYLHISLLKILGCMQRHENLKHYLDITYSVLAYEMTFLPIILIIAGKFNIVREYNRLLLISVILGFLFYYFLPTAAPSSILPHKFFMPEQLATSYKFWAIHEHLRPNILEGGMISMPSYHVIWAYYCLRMMRTWKFLYYPLAIINCCIVLSCVLLGWHYISDIFGSIAIIYMTRYIMRKNIMNLNIIVPLKYYIVEKFARMNTAWKKLKTKM
jgi:PAP2 superfamily